MRKGAGIHTPVDPRTFRPLANRDNDYLMDREAQKRGRTYGGISGFAMQDASIQESMGPIVDRSRENLVGTDKGIVMARRRLMRAAKALLDAGTRPPGAEPAHQRVRSAAVVLPPDMPFTEAAAEALATKAGSVHVSGIDGGVFADGPLQALDQATGREPFGHRPRWCYGSCIPKPHARFGGELLHIRAETGRSTEGRIRVTYRPGNPAQSFRLLEAKWSSP